MGRIKPEDKYNILEQRQFSCEKCGYSEHPEILHIHHIISTFDGGTNDCLNLLVLCPNCHSIIHYGDDTINKHNMKKKLMKRYASNFYFNHLTKEERADRYVAKKEKEERKKRKLIMKLLDRLLESRIMSKKRIKEILNEFCF